MTSTFQLLLATCTCLGLGQLGCATMAPKKLPATDRVIFTRQQPENSDPVSPRITQTGQTIHVQVDSECTLRAYDRVETTEHATRENKQAWVDWTFGISGATLLGVGGWVLADASKVYPNDTSSRTYNEVGPDTSRGIGVATMLTGGALLAVAVVDVIRAQHTEDGAPKVAERKGSLAGACPTMPVAGATVSGAFSTGVSEPIPLGTTDSDGTLDINLADLSPPLPAGDINGEPYGATLTILADGRRAGTASLSSVYPTWRASWEAKKTAEQAAESARRQAGQAMEACKKRCEDEVIACVLANGGTGPAAQMCNWRDRTEPCLAKCNGRKP